MKTYTLLVIALILVILGSLFRSNEQLSWITIICYLGAGVSFIVQAIRMIRQEKQ
ncbi:hypothetical protein GLW08_05400 [Pontibacillus yanchengensis]|uniref:Uncharacterized protein n=2 Tax=Pontibacillus yanchengensis TaxID=462910 RepID=A0A6I4ZW72_9BACI|nr:hypothetical protein [Pontibacillus yanchengensis]MYL32190.1 hypothetical protein [Pontibacillus yanchengensis]MYL52770.1 hypothetical protein [Pontibacillus yanchengensis]